LAHSGQTQLTTCQAVSAAAVVTAKTNTMAVQGAHGSKLARAQRDNVSQNFPTVPEMLHTEILQTHCNERIVPFDRSCDTTKKIFNWNGPRLRHIASKIAASRVHVKQKPAVQRYPDAADQ
jgi:hypothetical protein